MILLLLCLAGACGCGLWLNYYVPLLPVPFLPLGEFFHGDEVVPGTEPEPFYQAFLVRTPKLRLVLSLINLCIAFSRLSGRTSSSFK